MSRVVIVGSGGEPYRRYAMETVTAEHEVAMVLTAPPTWQREFTDDFAVVDRDQPGDMAAAIAGLVKGHSEVGVLTWDEVVLEEAAAACELLRLPMIDAAATVLCRDKLRTRERLARHCVPSARFAHVHTRDEARRAARDIGYPVVLKPRSLAGSAGVVVVHDPAELDDSFAIAAGARYGTLPLRDGVLVEEYLTGPEISVDAVSWADGHRILQTTCKEVGFPPYFEEVAHSTGDLSQEPWFAQAQAVASAAVEALEVHHSITHTELKLTPRGPVVVEVNGRLGGDFIPLLGRISGGPDQVRAAVDVSLGRIPADAGETRLAARVSFVYPPADARLVGMDPVAAKDVAGVVDVIPLARPGDVLRLPPRAVLGRAAAILTTGETPHACEASAREAMAALAPRWEMVT